MKVKKFNQYCEDMVTEKFDIKKDSFKILSGDSTTGNMRLYAVIISSEQCLVNCVKKVIGNVKETEHEVRFYVDLNKGGQELIENLIGCVNDTCKTDVAEKFVIELENQMRTHDEFLDYGNKIKKLKEFIK